MPQVTVGQLFHDNRDALKLSWLGGEPYAGALLDSRRINQSTQGLIGHLNFYHPNWIQIFSRTEASYFPTMDLAAQEQQLARLQDAGLACVVVSDGEQPPPAVLRFADARKLMAEHRISGIPVVEKGGRLVGILTNRDVRFATDPKQPIAELMTKMHFERTDRKQVLRSPRITTATWYKPWQNNRHRIRQRACGLETNNVGNFEPRKTG